MVINLHLGDVSPTTVKIFTTDGRLKYTLLINDMLANLDLGFLSKGTYLFAISNALRTYTTRLKIN